VKQQFVSSVNALFDPHPAGLNLEQFSAVVQEVSLSCFAWHCHCLFSCAYGSPGILVQPLAAQGKDMPAGRCLFAQDCVAADGSLVSVPGRAKLGDLGLAQLNTGDSPRPNATHSTPLLCAPHTEPDTKPDNECVLVCCIVSLQSPGVQAAHHPGPPLV
jgi:hypothetical protein